MNLRNARIDDHWRRTFTRQYPTRFESIKFSGLSTIADGVVHFAPGITAIVGGNGVGKSTLIAAVAELLSNGVDSSVTEGFGRVGSSTTSGVAFQAGGQLTLAMRTDGAGIRSSAASRFTGEYRWLDPAIFGRHCLLHISGDANFEDLLESVTPIQLAPEELELISYLVGKDYASCSIYEIPEYGELDRFPYFRVRSGGEGYSSEGMGRGELALLLTYWVLRDLPKCSILILEEPETHVSPLSQDRMMNLVAKFCDENAIWVIATTHSPSVIRRLPVANIRMLARAAGTARMMATTSLVQVATILSGGVAFKGMLLVEDAGAKQFVLSMLEDLAPDLLPQFEVVLAGSAPQMSAALENLPKTSDWLTVVGIYDGDMEGKIETEEFQWPALFLPGGVAPERLFKEFVTSQAEVQVILAERLGKTLDDVTVALNCVAGIDHHEWMSELATALNREVKVVHQALVSFWIERSRQMADDFTARLRSAIKQAHSVP
jgi:predicted ATPase